MKLGQLVSKDAKIMDGAIVFQVRSQVLFVEGLGDLSDKEFDGVRFPLRTRRLYGAASGQFLDDRHLR